MSGILLPGSSILATRADYDCHLEWNAHPDSLISSAEGAEDGVAMFTSQVRAGD